jgi:peptidoglycan/xylan/chitin deacetylase (PgdA/CDA1 family)
LPEFYHLKIFNVNEELSVRSNKVGRFLSITKLDSVVLGFQKTLFGHQFARAVFYHDTPLTESKNLEAHFKFYKDHFSSVSLNEATEFLETGYWAKKLPGIIICFDDAFRSNYEVAYPLLQKYSLVGWFSIPTGFVDSANCDSETWANQHSILPRHRYPDGRVSMSWDEVRELDAAGHVIFSHTVNHHRMSIETPQRKMSFEIKASKLRLEEELQHEIYGYTWVGGEEWTYHKTALAIAREAGYKYLMTSLLGFICSESRPCFMNRVGVESEADLNLVKFQLSGLIDMYTLPRRRRVQKLLFSDPSY